MFNSLEYYDGPMFSNTKFVKLNADFDKLDSPIYGVDYVLVIPTDNGIHGIETVKLNESVADSLQMVGTKEVQRICGCGRNKAQEIIRNVNNNLRDGFTFKRGRCFKTDLIKYLDAYNKYM